MLLLKQRIPGFDVPFITSPGSDLRAPLTGSRGADPRHPSSPVLLFRRLVRFPPSPSSHSVLSATLICPVLSCPAGKRGHIIRALICDKSSRPVSHERRRGHSLSTTLGSSTQQRRFAKAAQLTHEPIPRANPSETKKDAVSTKALGSPARHLLRPAPTTQTSLAQPRTCSLLDTTY